MQDAHKLSAELEELTELLYVTPTGVAQIDRDGAIRFINPQAVRLLMQIGRKGDQLDNLFDTLEPVAPDLRLVVQAFDKENGDILRDQHLVVSSGTSAGGAPMVYSLTLQQLDTARIMVALHDVSESVRREHLIRRQDSWINAVLAGVNDYAITLLDAHGHVLHWNAGIQQLTGYRETDVLGQFCTRFFAADDGIDERLRARLREASVTGVSLDEGWMLTASGARFWGHSVIMPCAPGAPHEAYALVIRNVSDQRQAMDALLQAATRDQLTGLANRRSFFDALELELMRFKLRPRPVSLLLVDIDQLARINTSHGQSGGDAVLRDLARILSGSVREFDLVARIGGQEFGILLPATTLDAAHAVAERVRELVVEGLASSAGTEVRYTVSVGVAEMISEFSGSASLLQAAQRALGAAKRAGRNRVCVA